MESSSAVRNTVKHAARSPFWRKQQDYIPYAFQKLQVPTFPRLEGNHRRVDVCVIGGGIFGLSTALRLQEQGRSVAIVEADRVGAGVTANSTCKLSSLHRLKYHTLESKHGAETARQYALLSEMGIDRVRSIVLQQKDRYGQFMPQEDIQFVDAPHITYVSSEEDSEQGNLQQSMEMIRKEVEAAQRAGLKASFIAGGSNIDNDLPFNVQAAIRVDNQAMFNAYAYCVAMANAMQQCQPQVQIFEGSRVQSVNVTTHPPFRITTEHGSIESENVVVATHLPFLDRSGHFATTKASRSYCIAVTLNDNSRMPRNQYISAGTQGTANRSFRPTDNGQVLVLAGCGHAMGDEKQIGFTSTEQCYEWLEKFARQHWPVKSVVCRWSAHDYMPADQLPYIGLMHHGVTGLYTATGFQKWGLAMSQTAALMVSEMIAGTLQHDPLLSAMANTFDARRWDITGSTKNLMEYQAFVAKHFVGDRLKDMVGLPDIESLTLDTGAICKDPKHGHVAAYRGTDGTLHRCSILCKHLGCHVRWNQGDRTWDCPCHGSRYGVDGDVLHGPATKGLDKYQ